MANDRIFELRTYLAAPGKLALLEARFRDHTMALFEKHGLEVVGFFVDESAETLVYLLAFDSLEAAERNWAAFRGDPAWQEAFRLSEVDGRLAAKVESRFLAPTDYSPLR